MRDGGPGRQLTRRHFLRATGAGLAATALFGAAGRGAAAAAPGAAADEYDALRVKWLEMITGGSAYDPADPNIAAALAQIDATARLHWDGMEKGATRAYLWGDLASTTISSHVTNSYGRLRAMARAYAAHGGGLAGNPALADDLAGALDWLYANRYNENKAKYDNWWDWELGTPLVLNDTVVLSYDALTTAQRASYMAAIDRFSPTIAGGDMGANRVWRATVVGVRGVIVKDGAKIAQARDGLSNVFLYVTSRDGFYRDGSFIQHERHPYTGGYGKSLLSDIANLLHLLGGSRWEVTDPNRQNVYRWVYDSFEPLIYRGAFMDLARGRELARENVQDHVVGQITARTIARLAESAPAADALAFRRMVKEWILGDTYRPFFANAPLVFIALLKPLLADASIARRGELLLHKQFPSMDRVIHLRPGFGFALSLSSSRIWNYESINGENLKAWYTADGMTYLYNDDLGQYSEDFWATVNPYRLPGTTVDTQPRGATSIQYARDYLSPKDWVGGAALLARYGAAGMDLAASGDRNADGTVKTPSSLTAKKSWFMFDDAIVALGAGITSADGRPIETIVENRRLGQAGDNALTVGGATAPAALGWSATLGAVGWLHLDGAGGYYFPGPATVNGLREARTGSWRAINRDGPDRPITRNYLTLWLAHGPSPANASYAYVLLPNRTAAETAAYSANPAVTVLTNTAEVQAARETGQGVTGANFWTGGRAGPIRAYGQASIVVKEGGGELTLAVADPTQKQDTITIELSKAGLATLRADPTVTVSQLAPTIRFAVRVAGSRGASHAASFSYDPDAPTSRPAVRDLAPVADTFVRGGVYGAANYGGEPSLAVSNAGGDYTRQAFLKFDLGGVGGELDSAVLFVYAACTDAKGTTKDVIACGVADDGWTERGLTWNGKPAVGPPLTTVTVDNAFRWRAFDVTPFVRAQLAGDRVAGLALVQEGAGLYVNVNSRENGANRPYLQVTTYSLSGPQLATLALSADTTLLGLGATTRLRVSGTLEDGSAADLAGAAITYASDNEAVATVDGGGTVTAAGVGTATVTAGVTLGTVTKTATVPIRVPVVGPTIQALAPVADAFVRSGLYGNDNYGGQASLAVSNAGGDYTRQAYFRFDLGALSGEIDSATLYLYAICTDSKGTVKECQARGVIDDGWTEGGLTWNTKPAVGGVLSTVAVNNAWQWRAFDVTPFVQARQAGDKLASLALVQEGAGLYVNINSRENGANRPYLQVTTYSMTPPDQTGPAIAVEGVADGGDYTGSVTPVVTAADSGSGVKSLAAQLDGQPWAAGTAVTARGAHTLVATATDFAGNTATTTIRFALYHATALRLEPAAGVYSDPTNLRATLADAAGQPIAGATVAFAVGGAGAGTAVTDARGTAALPYIPPAGPAEHAVRATVAQDDAAYFRGSAADGALTAAPEEATIAYTGATTAPSGGPLALAARVAQQEDGAPGALGDLPVRFTLARLNADGTTAPYTDTSVAATHRTDDGGRAVAEARPPAGLYAAGAALLPNDRYRPAEAAPTTVAVYDAAAGGGRANGHFDLAAPGPVVGAGASKMHLETEWAYGPDGQPRGSLTLHAEPRGLRLRLDAAAWLVVAGGGAWVQGSTRDEGGAPYTVRLALQAQPAARASLTLWAGATDQGEPAFQALDQPFSGSVRLGRG